MGGDCCDLASHLHSRCKNILNILNSGYHLNAADKRIIQFLPPLKKTPAFHGLFTTWVHEINAKDLGNVLYFVSG